MFHKGGPGKQRGFGFGGFSMGRRRDEPPSPPPSSSSSSSRPTSSLLSRNMPQYPISAGGGAPFILKSTRPLADVVERKRYQTEQDYFDDSDEDLSASRKQADVSDEEDEDPLDAFMAGLENDLQKESKGKEAEKEEEVIVEEKVKGVKGTRQDIEEFDDHETYFKYMEDNPNAGLLITDDDDEIEYDEDGNPIIPEKNKIIDPLPPIDHDEINYSDFSKDFYEEHEDISQLRFSEMQELRRKLGVKVSGYDPPKPVSSFGHFGFDEQLMHYIRKSEYSTPTPIQAQGVPIAMSGRDIIGIAKTGSGKTAAFIWPLLIHIMDQKDIKPGDGPIGLICAPTRELSQQIHQECKKFGKAYNIHTVCAYGGGNMWEQTKACQAGCEILVATPGRLIDLVKRKATNLERVTFLVLDEADRMFDMGFEPQVRSIANHVRPDRQTLLFSATFRKKVERLARDILTDPIRVIQGDLGEANEDVVQIVECLSDGPAKWPWLIKRLVSFTTEGSVLIFVTKKANSEELASNLKTHDFDLGLLHGDMDQSERNKVITNFKKQQMPILVATDVAARGLDIPSIKTVVNYDVARDIDTHTHRIGRTGRAGIKGTAYTLVTQKDVNFAGDLVRNLEGAGQRVPEKLMDLAMQNSWFRKARHRKGKKGRTNRSRGLGYKERPGLGSAPEEERQSSDRTNSGNQSDRLSSFTSPTSTSSSLSNKTNTSDWPERGPSSGPPVVPKFTGTDRISTMRSAFMSQYKSHFKAASSNSTSNTWTPGNEGSSRSKSTDHGFSAPKPPKKVKKTRWDN
ncbi:ATP-dependent RNA helicase DDX42-like [Saccoglossus kowalevskii]|uniref:RNA helicase n=1 Tax=Saccoglossus kowalevskii TaxID=10224 RepID=A0ABM0GLW2_SACKO|nr:PREDICTED: ATP-dependent RNA helicase DDX42-like [Saccoglossus kowalevskii]